jgi:hypothetical protein
MIDPPQITQTAGLLTAFIHLTVPHGDIRKVMGPGLDEVKAAIAAQGIATTGPWFTHHLRMEPGIFDFEICVPVAAPIDPAPGEGGPMAGDYGGADNLSWELRRARRCVG